MIAGGDDDGDPRCGEGVDDPVQQPESLDRGNRPVEYVTGDDDAVDRLGHRKLEDEVDGLLLRGVHRNRVEGSPQMPIGCVKQSHADPPTVVCATRLLRGGWTTAP